jgi:hypothetical protein
MRPRRKKFQRMAIALRDDLDRAVIAIAGVADKSERSCLLGGRGAKKDSLHPAAHEHPQPSAIVLSAHPALTIN